MDTQSPSQPNRLTLESLTDYLQFDADTLALISFRSKVALDQDFICQDETQPVFAIGYLDDHRRYRLLDSRGAQGVRVEQTENDAARTFTATFSQIGGHDLRVICSVTASSGDALTRWKIRLENPAGLQVVDVQYPFVVCSFDLQGAPGSEAILLPHGYGSGRLIERPGEAILSGGTWRQKLGPDWPREWEFCSRNGDANHYPGMQFAQFLAYYNDRAGFYLACEDTQANVKRFAAVQRVHGLRLGVAHVGDWPAPGERSLEYDTVTRSFQGDWYDAADLYRDWTSQQKWFVPLRRRHDIPRWLLESPVYVTVRPQGVVDAGPVLPVDEFIPYEKCLPLLQNVSTRVQSPLAVILMGWERAGSWVYPDALPPIGGDESMHQFIQSVRSRGWHAGCFSSGTRWVTGQSWNGYDGQSYYEQNGGEASICREADGSGWRENWDMDWRPSYACCVGAEKTRQVAQGYVGHLIGWGMESLQFLDQNNGSSTFPCFATDHEHPPVPGKWMAAKMRQFMEELHAKARELGEPGVAHSAESGLNEVCLQLFQQTELRTYPPGYGVDVVPLYQYLFHECVVLQGMMGNAPEPFHLAIRNAVNCVLGGMPGGVLTGDGTLLDKDTNNWAPWEPKVEDADHAFDMIRSVAALRRGPARDFLVYGRMLRPAAVSGIRTIEWNRDGKTHRIPAVFHSAWRAPDGRTGIVLANWTSAPQTVSIPMPVLSEETELALHLSVQTLASTTIKPQSGPVTVALPAQSCACLEWPARH